MITFGKEICQNLKASSSREWLETNGIGGFASSTVSGINTRRYHAILTASLNPPVQRMVLVNQYEESVLCGNSEQYISSHEYRSPFLNHQSSIIFPEGYRRISQFVLDPWPKWTYESDSWKIEKEIFMIHGQNSTVTLYRLIDSSHHKIKLKIRPLLTARDYHALHKENPGLDFNPEVLNKKVSFRPYQGVPELHLYHNGSYRNDFHWYKHFYYSIENERGLDDWEDCWSPGEILFNLNSDEYFYMVASVMPDLIIDPPTLLFEEKERRNSIIRLTGMNFEIADEDPEKPALDLLLKSADQFIVTRGGKQKSIIAGYPWFTDWGRDTFISMFGLCFSTERTELAKQIIESFSSYVNRGMIPNYFPDYDELPHYNSADASLWFILAVYEYWQKTGDINFLKNTVWQKCVEIIRSYKEGTRYKIILDSDGLVSVGEPGALTWMDARVYGSPVTPRIGKPVEMQALWFNALNMMKKIAESLNQSEKAKEYEGLANWCVHSFEKTFWYEEGNYLYDVVHGNTKDHSLRPNQIFAVTLPFELVSREKAALILKTIEKNLLTPYGLRSLSPSHPEYRKIYEGDPVTRDLAYHQGTVWSWLMGPFIRAYLKIHHHSEISKENAKKWIQPLLNHLYEEGLGTVSEIFDGNAPHKARGSVSQAWSVSELLRILQDLESRETGDHEIQGESERQGNFS